MSDIYAGHLLKWTNYIKGYQRRWFVLQNGILSYYRNQQEVAHTCRGSINLANAYIHSEDSQTFVISNGSTQFYLKAVSDAERKDWVTVLEIARNNAIKLQESDEDGDDISDSSRRTDEIQSSIASLRTKLDDLRTCHDLIVRQAASMVRTMQDLEQIAMTASNASSQGGSSDTQPPSMEQIVSCMRTLLQSTTMFRITSQAMVNAAGSYRELAETSGRRWQRMLQAEHDQRQRLEEMVQELARQQQSLENEAKQIQLGDGSQALARDRRLKSSAHPPSAGVSTSSESARAIPRGGSAVTLSTSSPSTASINSPDQISGITRHPRESAPDEEFFDAEEQLPDEYSVVLPTQVSVKRSSSAGISDEAAIDSSRPDTGTSGTLIRVADDEDTDEEHPSTVSQVQQVKVVPSEKKVARMRSQQYQAPTLPRSSRKRRSAIPEKPNSTLSLWSIMKNCIGRDLSKIPLPVNFNEPLSMLQRLCEEFEYSECLDLAAKCTDPCEQLAYVAAFTVSGYASTSNRTTKPFNPLLGETYEFDRRDDYGWRYVAEQVSHHPPMAGVHCESANWSFWQELSFQSKFRGKYLVVVPAGIAHIKFSDGNHYTFSKVTTTVHNIIVGKLWVEHHGEMDIVNHTTRDTCHLKYNSWSLFNTSQARQVTGVITDAKGQARYVLRGKWDDRMEGAKVERIRHGSSMSGNNDPDQVLETGDYRILWQRRVPPLNSAKMYNFTQLAVEINEEEERVAPTDSRRRPDQRFMEQGLWDDANKHKQMLEDKQRVARRQREIDAENLAAQGRQYPEYQPAWFRKQMDPLSGKIIHAFSEEYWSCKERQDWSRCPEIY